MVYAKCHPARRHEAKGLCKPCYCETIKKKSLVKAKCHPNRRHRAKGLCDSCYTTSKRNGLPNYHKVMLAMNTWKKSLDDLGTMRRVLEGIFGKNNPAQSQELL